MELGEADVRKIYRYEVPIDDDWHRIQLRGDVLHVDTRSTDQVEFWAMHDADTPPLAWHFRVYPTGFPLPADAVHVGTALSGPFVWHLMKQATE